jgi:hypothetical protein
VSSCYFATPAASGLTAADLVLAARASVITGELKRVRADVAAVGTHKVDGTQAAVDTRDGEDGRHGGRCDWRGQAPVRRRRV